MKVGAPLAGAKQCTEQEREGGKEKREQGREGGSEREREREREWCAKLKVFTHQT